jgi:ATP-dependent Clp protease adaptor protein ClpS
MDKIQPSSIIIRPSATLPEIEILEESETELEPLFKVIIHNDNITPMDFVVDILKTVFYLANDKASDIMLTAHVYGSAYVQTLARSEAQQRIDKAHTEALNAGYPLKFTMEPE